MFILQTEPRAIGVSAKHLRQSGCILVCLYGGGLSKSALLQARAVDAKRLLKCKNRGGRVMLNLGGEKADAILREIGLNPVDGRLEHLSFQKLSGGELIAGTAKIELENREKIPAYIQQALFELPYRARASHLTETVSVDLADMHAGDCIRVRDLAIAGDDDIELLVPPESVVLSLIPNRNAGHTPTAEA